MMLSAARSLPYLVSLAHVAGLHHIRQLHPYIEPVIRESKDKFHPIALGNLRERDHCGDPDVDGRVILRWIFRKWEEVVGTGWSWLRIGTGGGRLWGEESSGSENAGNFLTSCRNQLAFQEGLCSME